MQHAIRYAFVAAAFAGAAILLAALPPARALAAGEATVVDLPVRPGVTLRYLALAPEAPAKAAVLLFIGGEGVANIPDKPSPSWAARGNFLARSRELFRGHGLFVAIADAPSDRRSAGGLGGFRLASQHADDVAAVIADIRQRSGGVPVWLVGTSLGTVSAVNAAARLEPPHAADGLVLSSTLTGRATVSRSSRGNTETVYGANLAAIRLPTLLVYHRADACAWTRPADVAALQRALTGARRTSVVAIDGGDPPRSDGCGPLDAHGFLGRETETVAAIADWILGAKPSQ